MRRAWLILLFLLSAGTAFGGPAEAFAAALADAATLPPKDRAYTVYALDRPRGRVGLGRAAGPGAEGAAAAAAYADFGRLLTLHANGLSREASFGRPLVVAGTAPPLYRLDIRDYGWRKKTWEKLADLDPYFHARVEAAGAEVYYEDENWPGGVDRRDGKYYPPGRYKVERERKVAAREVNAFHLPADPAAPAKLATLLHNKAPLVRADWFWLQTVRNIDRNNNANTGAGYYDFLDVRDERDLEDLAGVSRKLAERARKETRAIIKASGVNVSGSRQVQRLDGGYWETLDADKVTKESNPLRQLNGDFVAKAKEVYGRLPNALWFYAAVNVANGKLQDSVPDSIASDHGSTDNDKRIHPSLSCVGCHLEGLRPLNDWARRTYRVKPLTEPRFPLDSLDPEKHRRLQQLYLTPMLTTWYDVDQLVYARALHAVVGWTPRQAAEAYRREWEQATGPVSGEQFAAELGTTKAEMLKAFAAAALARGTAKQGRIDPVLAGYLDEPEDPSARSLVEEVFPQAALYITGKADP